MSNIRLKYAFLMFLLQTICTSSLLMLQTDLEQNWHFIKSVLTEFRKQKNGLIFNLENK